MKKLLLMLCLCGVFAACGEKNEQVSNEKKIHLTFATQEVGTGAYQYASAISNIFLKGLPEGSNIDLTTESPGGVGAPIIIENKQCDLIMSNAGPAKWAGETGILGKEPTESVMAIAGGMGQSFLNVMFTQEFVDKTGITTVEELVAKKYPVRIAIKKVGAFGNMACEKLFESLGITFDDIKSWGGSVDTLGADAIKIYIQDGKADMTIDHIAAGQANTTELCMTKPMFFPQLSDKTLAKLANNGFDYVDIEPNTWNRQTELIKSVGSQQVILVHKDLDEEVAYKLTKALCEGKDELAQQIASLSYFNPETAWTQGQAGAKIHPGAERYYREQGYMK